MESSSPRIITVNSELEANFARKFLSTSVVLSFNSEAMAIGVDPSLIFIYPQSRFSHSILDDPSILKLIAKPIPAVKKMYPSISNYKHFADSDGMQWPLLNQMNLEIIQAGNHFSIDPNTRQVQSTQPLDQIAATVARIMLKYKYQAEHPTMIPKSSFNADRDCFLLYLTAYNDLLSRYGPMKFIDLTARVKDYPQLCRVDMNPARALEGLIATGALLNDRETSVVSLPA